MPYINRRGDEMKQITVWIPTALHALAKADGLNMSSFFREQLEALYEDESTVETLNEKFRLMSAAKEFRKKHLETTAHETENRERLKDNVRAMRNDRIVEKAREVDVTVRAEAKVANIGSAWDILVKKKRINPSGLLRRLPENDSQGTHLNYWTELARDMSKVAGETITDLEVINYAKHRIATV